MNPLWPVLRFLPASLRAFFTPVPALEAGQALTLARILQVRPADLAALRLGNRYHYRPFTIAKRDGRERRILAPSPALKELQRRLLHNYLAQLPAHPAATAFYPGASNAANARQHAGQTLVATADLADFFESTSAARVRAFFRLEGWRGQALSTLIRLCVYRGGLPQGAPTSPCLSNLVNAGLDQALSDLAGRAGARYTRYGDDLTFSWSAGPIPAHFETAVRDQLDQAGYTIQPRKAWRVYHASEAPQITGLTLAPRQYGALGRAEQVRAPAHIYRQIRRLRWQVWWARFRRQPDALAEARLRGYEGYLKSL